MDRCTAGEGTHEKAGVAGAGGVAGDSDMLKRDQIQSRQGVSTLL